MASLPLQPGRMSHALYYALTQLGVQFQKVDADLTAAGHRLETRFRRRLEAEGRPLLARGEGAVVVFPGHSENPKSPRIEESRKSVKSFVTVCGQSSLAVGLPDSANPLQLMERVRQIVGLVTRMLA